MSNISGNFRATDSGLLRLVITVPSRLDSPNLSALEFQGRSKLKQADMKQINLGIIGTGWCGGIRAVAASTSPWVKELHIAEIREERLKEVTAQTNPVTATTDYRTIVENPAIDAVM